MTSGKPLVHSRLNYQLKPGDIKLPCGNCIGCRLDRSKQWAVRLMLEAQLHKKNSFITLTYNEGALASRRPTWEPTVPYTPPSEIDHRSSRSYHEASSQARPNLDSLRPRDVQLFMKRLRKDLSTRKGSAKVRFYLVGEYGERFQRPHYHIALFGEDFSDDRTYWRTSGDHRIYRSSRLEKLWTYGNSEIGELTLESAAYVASYVLKKVNGKLADEHYRRTDPATGQDIWVHPEFAHMSRGGKNGKGLAAEWFAKYSSDVYPEDHVIHNGLKLKPPRYFDKLLEKWDPAAITAIRFNREMRAKELAADNTPARLAVKETVTKAKLALKKRQLEKP